jgi:hypothetical protein
MGGNHFIYEEGYGPGERIGGVWVPWIVEVDPDPIHPPFGLEEW